MNIYIYILLLPSRPRTSRVAERWATHIVNISVYIYVLLVHLGSLPFYSNGWLPVRSPQNHSTQSTIQPSRDHHRITWITIIPYTSITYHYNTVNRQKKHGSTDFKRHELTMKSPGDRSPIQFRGWRNAFDGAVGVRTATPTAAAGDEGSRAAACHKACHGGTIPLPSGYVKIAIEKMVIYSGFTHWKWWFSIVMKVYQMVAFILTSIHHGVIENIQFGNSRESSNLGMRFFRCFFFVGQSYRTTWSFVKIGKYGIVIHKWRLEWDKSWNEMKLMEVLMIFNENVMEPNEGFCSHVWVLEGRSSDWSSHLFESVQP